jgi:hypothetical protein
MDIKAKWRLEMKAFTDGEWRPSSAHVSADAAKTRARSITGWYSDPPLRIVAPSGEVYAAGQKQNGRMRWEQK